MRRMNKKGQMFTDLFLFMIITFVILVVCGMFIYFGLTTYSQLRVLLSGQEVHPEYVNYTQIVDNSMGSVNTSFATLYWLSILIIVGMIISIFIGGYFVTTRPVFFVPYIFVVIIAVIISAGISNAYQTLSQTPELVAIYNNFIGANYIMYFLPIWVTAIGFIGGIIMFVRMKSEEAIGYYA